MHKSNIALIVVTAVAAIIDWRVAIGIILGYLFSLVHSWVLKLRFGSLNPTRVKLGAYLGVLFGLIVLAIPMLIAMLLPQFVHFFGVFIGLVYQKYTLYVQAIRNKG